MGEMSPWHWAIVILIAVLLFGAKRLPDVARSMGRSARILKAELKADSPAPAGSEPADTNPVNPTPGPGNGSASAGAASAASAPVPDPAPAATSTAAAEGATGDGAGDAAASRSSAPPAPVGQASVIEPPAPVATTPVTIAAPAAEPAESTPARS